jgi:hypothetical protein
MSGVHLFRVGSSEAALRPVAFQLHRRAFVIEREELVQMRAVA